MASIRINKERPFIGLWVVRLLVVRLRLGYLPFKCGHFKPLALCLLLCACSFQPVRAQTFAEWFSQKKTLIKYLSEQVTAVLQYRSYIEQGYRISQGGLGSIGNWVKGEFNLHSAYYSSLRKVNPAIKSNGKADSIVRTAERIPPCFDLLHDLDGLSIEERQYLSLVKESVLGECDKDLAELEMVVTDGKAQLSDDERITRLDAIAASLKNKLLFARSFCSNARLLVLQRQQEQNNINSLKSIYEID